MKLNKKLNQKYFLFINTSKPNELDVFLLMNNRIISKLSLKGNYKVSENLLKLINKLLKKNKLGLGQLKGIIAVSGPGPFTSLRIAAAVANTLAFALKIPIAGVANKENLSDMQLIKKGLKEMKIGNYIQPFYNQEPNITIAK
ncbi:MAG: tRNA (adenosine(37)-N6)-threonylcarbamoyltransferase complex dimerization subunit type 1 TsaB [Patescibacteria group bacterium]